MSWAGKSCCVVLSKRGGHATMVKRVCQEKRFMRKLGVDDKYLMTGNGLNYEPDTSKGSSFLTSLFPVPLCNEFLVVWAWLREKGRFHTQGQTDVCRLARSHTHTHRTHMHESLDRLLALQTNGTSSVYISNGFRLPEQP